MSAERPNLPAVVEHGAPVTASTLRSSLIVPSMIAEAGDRAARRFLDFFAASIENDNTRMAYYRAACSFFAWLDQYDVGELADIADDAMKRRYVEFIKGNCPRLPNTIILDAIDGLFPHILNIADFLAIIAQIEIADADGGVSFEWQAAGWIDRIKTRSELEQVLRGLLNQLGPGPQDIGHIPDKREEGYFSAIAAAACGLLEHCSQGDAPVDAIDAALRIGIAHRHAPRSLHELGVE